MASIFQVFDLNEALAEAKQPRRHVAGGFEAPRNSLDVGSKFEAPDVSTSASFHKPEDIPFGYEYYNPALAASGGRWKRDGSSRSVGRDRLEQSETKRRAPNVVARLMGLDALPDELPTVRPRKSLQEMPTYGCAKPEGGNPVLIRQHSQGAVPSSWQRPPLPRTVQRATASVEEERAPAPVLPFRDHPQEEQLQKFKKEFEAKQQERSRASQLEEMNRHLEEKKNKVRATLDKARIALSQGIIAEPKRLNGQGKFEESKEFLDAMEFLQCNKDFIFQFLQQKPHVVFSNENSNATTPVTHAKPLKKGKGYATSPRDSTERKREGFSPRAIARLFMPSDSRKRNDHNKQQAATSGPQPAIERCNSAGSRRLSTESRDMSEDVKLRTSSSTNSRYMLPPASPKVQVKPSKDEARVSNKNGARDVIVEIKERLRRREQQSGPEKKLRYAKDSAIRKEHLQGSLRDSKEIAREIAKNAREAGSRKSSNFTLTKSLSTGKRISMMRPDMDDVTCTSDGEDISTPSVKIVRENVTRSCISLPSSPHLSARSHEAAASPKVTRKRATENTKPLPTDPTDSPATLRAAERAMATKKTCLTSESPRRGSPRSNTEGEKQMRRSASVNENANRSNALKQKIDSPVSTGKRLLDPVNEPASNLTRSRSVPNVALLRERGQCTTETARTLGSGTAKSTSKVLKSARGQNGDKRKLGFFSVGRKKGRDDHVPEAMPSSQQALFPSPSPVLSRVAALAESCVSQSNTLSDADSAVNVRIHVRSSRNGSKKGKDNPREMVACAEVDKARRESSFPDESVVPESSADSEAAPCEDEFLEVLSQLTPLAKRKSTTESPRTGASALPNTVCPPSPHTHVQVQSDKKSPKPPRAWKTARNILDNVDDAHDSNSDKNGQPSPVSVLEPPFEEESPSPLEFKEITNDLQELRIRLRLLKADGSERARDDVENVPEMLTHRDTQRSEVPHQSLSRTSSTNSPSHKSTNAERSHPPPDNLIPPPASPCPTSPEADFAFVRDILVTSGFHTHGGRNITRWHSSTQPISHHLFQKVEASYSNKLKSTSHRRILFDAINEVLVAQLEPQCYEQPWLQITSRNTKSYVATGRRLVEDVWNEIHKRQFPARCRDFHNDYLESLVAQDLQTSRSWLSLRRDADRICLHLEKAIWSDLMEELCGGL